MYLYISIFTHIQLMEPISPEVRHVCVHKYLYRYNVCTTYTYATYIHNKCTRTYTHMPVRQCLASTIHASNTQRNARHTHTYTNTYKCDLHIHTNVHTNTLQHHQYTRRYMYTINIQQCPGIHRLRRRKKAKANEQNTLALKKTGSPGDCGGGENSAQIAVRRQTRSW